jgi:hypothetical protein
VVSSGNYTVGTSDRTVIVTSTASPTITLPDPTTNADRIIYVMAGGNHFTLGCSVSTKIQDGSGTTNGSTFGLTNSVLFQYGYWTLICVSDGNYWYIN